MPLDKPRIHGVIMICRIIQHVSFEDLGLWETVLREQGYTLLWHQAGVNLPGAEEWLEADLAIVLGGPIGVNDEEMYPFIRDEINLARSRLDAGLPLLGICLGAQIMASALGAKIYPAARKEIEWAPVSLSEAGKLSPLRHLGNTPVLHWHGDTFDLPYGATLLCSTGTTPHQAFAVGNRALAVQFHPEADSEKIERWLIGHTCELVGCSIAPQSLRTDSLLFGETLREKSGAILREWLKNL